MVFLIFLKYIFPDLSLDIDIIILILEFVIKGDDCMGNMNNKRLKEISSGGLCRYHDYIDWTE